MRMARPQGLKALQLPTSLRLQIQPKFSSNGVAWLGGSSF